MSKAFNPEEWVQLRTDFEDLRDKQLLLMKSHESAGSYGMAYLALWVALEFFAKRLGPAAQRQDLKDTLSDWLAYLNGNGVAKPKEIASGKFKIPRTETERIPPEELLQKLFPLRAAPSFYLVTDPNRKYRIRRNDIAHKAEVTTLKVYEGFKEEALKALSEIEVWLSGGGV